jgi:AraC-like DNA-binding protein
MMAGLGALIPLTLVQLFKIFHQTPVDGGCNSGILLLQTMKDRNHAQVWCLPRPPAGAALWPRMTGRLTGFGESSYQFLPDYFCPHLVVRGRGTVTTAAGVTPVAAGDLFTLWPGTAIAYAEDPADPWEYYWLHLEGGGVEDYVRACGFSPQGVPFRARQPEVAERLFGQVHEVYGRRQESEASLVVSLLYQLVPACSAGAPPPLVEEPYRALVTRALMLIDGPQLTGLGVTEIATALGVDRTTLFRAFRVCLGESPLHRIMRARVRRAQDLLRTTDAKLAVVARAAGFGGEKYFLRRFRLATGATPAEWRRRQTTG